MAGQRGWDSALPQRLLPEIEGLTCPAVPATPQPPLVLCLVGVVAGAPGSRSVAGQAHTQPRTPALPEAVAALEGLAV